MCMFTRKQDRCFRRHKEQKQQNIFETIWKREEGFSSFGREHFSHNKKHEDKVVLCSSPLFSPTSMTACMA